MSPAAVLSPRSSPLALQGVTPRVVVFVLDQVGLRDILSAKAPYLQRFLRVSAVGLMNFASVRVRTPEGSYATLSAGMHAAAVREDGLFRNAGESYEGGSAADAFLRRTGQRVPPGTLVNLGIAPALQANLDRQTGAALGALGQIASRYGPTVALGNSDAPDPKRPLLRYTPLLAMRPDGTVDGGDLSTDLLSPDPLAPYGVATDEEKLETAYLQKSPGASLVVVDLGETTRAEAYREYLPQSLYRRHRFLALERADRLFRRLLSHIDLQQTRVVLLTPYPPLPDDNGPAVELAPFAMSGQGRGLALSDTTQGIGLVTNTDLAPTVAKWLRESPAGVRSGKAAALPMMAGTPLRVIAGGGDPLAYLQRLDAAVTAQRLAAGGAFLPAFAGILALLGGVTLYFAWGRQRLSTPQQWLARLCLCAVVMAPLALILAGEQMPEDLQSLVLVVLIAWAILSWLPLTVGKLAVPTALLASGLGILANLLTGGLGLRLSPISDFPIVGVRFHGLGNEYTGMAIGGVLMGTCGLLDAFPRLRSSKAGRLFLMALFLAATLLIGLPRLGDDAGGFLAAGLAFGSLLLLLYELPLNVRNVAGLFLLTFCGLWVVVLLDSAGASPTHLGQSIALARQQGVGALLEIITRKLDISFRIMTDPQTLFAYAGIGLLIYFAGRYDKGRLRSILYLRPGLALGVRAGVIGAITAWVFNDTGFVAALLIAVGMLCALIAAMIETPRRSPTIPLIQIQ